jgi:hypothetical protein
MNADRSYGRTPAEWAELEEVGWKFLRDTARQPVKNVTSYSEINHVLATSTGQAEWVFDRAADRAAMGELLGRLSDRSFDECGLMISALCMYLRANDVAPGFYNKAVDLGLLRPAQSRVAKEAFWLQHLSKVRQWALSK